MGYSIEHNSRANKRKNTSLVFASVALALLLSGCPAMSDLMKDLIPATTTTAAEWFLDNLNGVFSIDIHRQQ